MWYGESWDSIEDECGIDVNPMEKSMLNSIPTVSRQDEMYQNITVRTTGLELKAPNPPLRRINSSRPLK